MRQIVATLNDSGEPSPAGRNRAFERCFTPLRFFQGRPAVVGTSILLRPLDQIQALHDREWRSIQVPKPVQCRDCTSEPEGGSRSNNGAAKVPAIPPLRRRKRAGSYICRHVPSGLAYAMYHLLVEPDVHLSRTIERSGIPPFLGQLLSRSQAAIDAEHLH
jgi:hypothetical protein